MKTDKNNSSKSSGKNKEEHALQLGLRYLSFKPRTKHEISMYLMRKGYENIIIDKVLGKLSHYGYIDDKKYTRDYISGAIRSEKKSANIVEIELTKKGIPPGIIEDCIPAFSHDINLQIAKKISKNYFHRRSDLPYKQLKNRLSQFLARKRFTWEVIHSCLSYLDQNEEVQSIVASNAERHLSQATELAKKYFSRYSKRDSNPYSLQQKTKHALYRRGYSKTTIDMAMENILNKG